MRYIIAKNQAGMSQPFLGLAPVNHQQLAAQAALLGFDRPTSAGFAHLGPALGVKTYHRSESLNLDPAHDDAQLIHLHYRATLDLIPEFQLRPSGAPMIQPL